MEENEIEAARNLIAYARASQDTGHAIVEDVRILECYLDTMANMGYCRFENTAIDLRDCERHIDDTMDGYEWIARKHIIETAYRIVAPYLKEDGTLDEDEVKNIPKGQDDEEEKEDDE